MSKINFYSVILLSGISIIAILNYLYTEGFDFIAFVGLLLFVGVFSFTLYKRYKLR